MDTNNYFGVTAVKYTACFIDRIQGLAHHAGRVEMPQEMSRQEMIAAMHNGQTFNNVSKNGDIWEQIHLFVVSGVEYVKLFDDDHAFDDLGDLTEY